MNRKYVYPYCHQTKDDGDMGEVKQRGYCDVAIAGDGGEEEKEALGRGELKKKFCRFVCVE